MEITVAKQKAKELYQQLKTKNMARHTELGNGWVPLMICCIYGESSILILIWQSATQIRPIVDKATIPSYHPHRHMLCRQPQTFLLDHLQIDPVHQMTRYEQMKSTPAGSQVSSIESLNRTLEVRTVKCDNSGHKIDKLTLVQWTPPPINVLKALARQYKVRTWLPVLQWFYTVIDIG